MMSAAWEWYGWREGWENSLKGYWAAVYKSQDAEQKITQHSYIQTLESHGFLGVYGIESAKVQRMSPTNSFVTTDSELAQDL